MAFAPVCLVAYLSPPPPLSLYLCVCVLDNSCIMRRFRLIFAADQYHILGVRQAVVRTLRGVTPSERQVQRAIRVLPVLERHDSYRRYDPFSAAAVCSVKENVLKIVYSWHQLSYGVFFFFFCAVSCLMPLKRTVCVFGV